MFLQNSHLDLFSYYSFSVAGDYDYDEVTSVFPDKMSAFDNRESGRYFLQYLIYCATVYAFMFLRTRRTQSLQSAKLYQ